MGVDMEGVRKSRDDYAQNILHEFLKELFF